MRPILVRKLLLFVAGTVLLALSLAPCAAQKLSKRLILKDGTYQVATKWEVRGDRVRYYSAERDDWEEVPNSMVDWAATDQYEKARAAGAASPEAIQLEKQYEADRRAETANTPQVSPGLRLEDPHASYVLDTFNGEPQLIQLQQNGGTLVQDTKKTFFQGVVVGSNAKIVLTGVHASIQAHAPVPSLYVNAGGGPPEDADQSSSPPSSSSPPQQAALSWDRFRIVSVESMQDKRVVGRVDVSGKGKSKDQQDIVKTTDEQLTGGWVKLTPVDPLPPGEYALVELLGDEGMNLYVWDFGENSQAPENKNVIQPQPQAPAQPPTLQQR
jgi:hypothetical protein